MQHECCACHMGVVFASSGHTERTLVLILFASSVDPLTRVEAKWSGPLRICKDCRDGTADSLQADIFQNCLPSACNESCMYLGAA